ncbi:hypothetical protein BZL29_7800 [Mycobacterium kansasii]|uniref:Uncharacterized protein n=1 Tax=Mycobacterium kansasii TaxID=1768 RepID=A0A1V3WEP4_MYCKA|nr:hypothetical protein BZL29_7800 [Mycobacterium kansasii]
MGRCEQIALGCAGAWVQGLDEGYRGREVAASGLGEQAVGLVGELVPDGHWIPWRRGELTRLWNPWRLLRGFAKRCLLWLTTPPQRCDVHHYGCG